VRLGRAVFGARLVRLPAPAGAGWNAH